MLDDRTRGLLSLAERRVPARAANAEIDRERTRQELLHGRGVSYEIVLPAERGFAHLAEVVTPQLLRYLSAKQVPIERAAGVFLSLFVGEELYFITVSSFFGALREAEGLDAAAWRARLCAWGIS
jgi:hypothetical protein